MKTLRFAALSLMLLLSAGAFAQSAISFRGDTIVIYNKEVVVDTINNCENYNHLIMSGGRANVNCNSKGFKTITVGAGGDFTNNYSYTDEEHVKIYVTGGTFNNYGSIYSGEITLNGGSFINNSGQNTIEPIIVVNSGSFYHQLGTIDGDISLNGGQFVNNASIENTPIKLTGGEFANNEDIDYHSKIIVNGGIFSNYKENKYNDGGLPASITIDGGRFNNGVSEYGADFTVTGEITVKSGEFHNWGIVNPWFDNIKLYGGEFVNEPSGKITPNNWSTFIDGGTFTNKGNITSSIYKDISIYDGGEFVNETNATITGLSLTSYGKLTNNGTITLNSKDTTSIAVYGRGAITNNGIIDGKGMVISHGGECINAQGASIKHACMEYSDEYNQGDNAFINNYCCPVK